MKNLLTFLFIATLTGCAHQIQLNPNTDKFIESTQPIDQIVGYHISNQDRIKEVTTPGGGGDKVTYSPYKDSETILYTVLANKFKDVYLVKSLDDSSFIKEHEIQLIFIPKITTNSSSSSPFTWPPTSFTIDLTVNAIDAAGETVWSTNVKETGKSEFDEFKHDFSLSARRATEKTFLLLADKLESIPFSLTKESK